MTIQEFERFKSDCKKAWKYLARTVDNLCGGIGEGLLARPIPSCARQGKPLRLKQPPLSLEK